MFLQILAVIAEFEANLIRQRTREGMDIARQHGKLRGKQPAQDREIRRKPGLQKTSATFQPITDIDRNPLHGRAARRASRSPGLSAGLCPCSCPGPDFRFAVFLLCFVCFSPVYLDMPLIRA